MSGRNSGLRVLQVTDTHLFPSRAETLLGVCTQDSLDAVLEHALAAHRPDAILATGDLAQIGAPATYQRFAQTVRRYFDGPVLCVPGNHDISDAFSEGFANKWGHAVCLANWTLIGVDTHVDDAIAGHVAAAELLRLERALDASTGFLLVAGHHAPVDVDTSWLDRQRIDNGGALVDLMCRYDVRAYVFGHVHQTFEARIDDLRILSAPSTCFQFQSGTEEFAIDPASPGYRWLELFPDGSMTTEVVRLDNFSLTLDLTDTKY